MRILLGQLGDDQILDASTAQTSRWAAIRRTRRASASSRAMHHRGVMHFQPPRVIAQLIAATDQGHSFPACGIALACRALGGTSSAAARPSGCAPRQVGTTSRTLDPPPRYLASLSIALAIASALIRAGGLRLVSATFDHGVTRAPQAPLVAGLQARVEVAT